MSYHAWSLFSSFSRKYWKTRMFEFGLFHETHHISLRRSQVFVNTCSTVGNWVLVSPSRPLARDIASDGRETQRSSYAQNYLTLQEIPAVLWYWCRQFLVQIGQPFCTLRASSKEKASAPGLQLSESLIGHLPSSIIVLWHCILWRRVIFVSFLFVI